MIIFTRRLPQSSFYLQQEFLSCLGVGKITIVNGEDARYALPGQNVTIKWNFDQDLNDLLIRTWRLITATKDEALARIVSDGPVTKVPNSLPEFDILKPSTLVLINVDESYNGTYQFQLVPVIGQQETSFVTFSIAGKFLLTKQFYFAFFIFMFFRLQIANI